MQEKTRKHRLGDTVISVIRQSGTETVTSVVLPLCNQLIRRRLAVDGVLPPGFFHAKPTWYAASVLGCSSRAFLRSWLAETDAPRGKMAADVGQGDSSV